MRMVDLDLLNEKIAAMQACEPHYAFHFLNDAQNPSTEWECIEDMIENMPVIEAQPVKRGKWVFADDGYCRCSECKQKAPSIEDEATMTVYCPHCGVKMRG